MRRAALLLTALLAAPFAPPARAGVAPPGPGLPCGYEPDPGGGGGGSYDDYLMHGGPYVIADGTTARTGRITCTQLIDGWVDARITSPTGAGVVVLPPIRFALHVRDGATYALCTQVEIDGAGTFYLDATTGTWSTDPNAPCDVATTTQVPPQEVVDAYQEAYDEAYRPVYDAEVAYVDPAVCPVTGGDVVVQYELLWDCPPYEG